MRNTYEAYILVKLRDGRQFVCALNRRKVPPNPPAVPPQKIPEGWEVEVIWN